MDILEKVAKAADRASERVGGAARATLQYLAEELRSTQGGDALVSAASATDSASGPDVTSPPADFSSAGGEPPIPLRGPELRDLPWQGTWTVAGSPSNAGQVETSTGVVAARCDHENGIVTALAIARCVNSYAQLRQLRECLEERLTLWGQHSDTIRIEDIDTWLLDALDTLKAEYLATCEERLQAVADLPDFVREFRNNPAEQILLGNKLPQSTLARQVLEWVANAPAAQVARISSDSENNG